ncbi:hypothetical protein OSTOST_16011 [Ostertagia ostertagi]
MKLLALFALFCIEYSAAGHCRAFARGDGKLKDLPEGVLYYLHYEFTQHHATDDSTVTYYYGYPHGDEWTEFIAVCYSPSKGTPRTFCRNVTASPEDGKISKFEYGKISLRHQFDDYWNRCKKDDLESSP